MCQSNNKLFDKLAQLYFKKKSLPKLKKKTKGGYQNDIFDCQCSGGGCCQCLENCADVCKCGTPTIGKCLDVCCPRRVGYFKDV